MAEMGSWLHRDVSPLAGQILRHTYQYNGWAAAWGWRSQEQCCSMHLIVGRLLDEFFTMHAGVRRRSSSTHRGPALITETNRTLLVLFGMQIRTFGPYLAAMHRILISIVAASRLLVGSSWGFSMVKSCLGFLVGQQLV
jgi:hypothetical protein